ncbi:hypothetical protein [Rhizobium sp. YK2]|uniref:hypothetical protein n=1 Tax=Rhizobium sp. YK2 TaxID=1860096 RepID=UPI00084CD639|nr:hypothetical protein [Rhizobium sp. YK2]OEC93561.1 hypothetical protein A9Z06_09015 [Rhizobium sp. YK2]
MDRHQLRLKIPEFKMEVNPGAPWSLIVACILAFILVVLCGVTIGLIQFQSRLQSDASQTSIPEIASIARINRLLQAERTNYERLSAETRDASTAVFVKALEAGARVARVCATIDPGSPRAALCQTFLENIPFNQTPTGILPAIRSLYSDTAPEYDADETLKSAVAVLKIEDPTMKALLVQHSHEIEPIAAINVELETQLRPEMYRKYREQILVCEKIRELSLVLKTTSYPVQSCELLAEQANAAFYRPEVVLAQTGQANSQPQAVATPAIAATGTGTTAPTQNAAPQVTQFSNSPPSNAANPPSSSAPASSPPITPTNQQIELVSQYLFYQTASFGFLSTILQSPADFLSFFLVGLSGLLGGLLRVILAWSANEKNPSWRDLLVVVLLGLICSLIIYSLFRGGFMVITNADQKSATSGLNPFVVSVLGLASGLLSDRAIARFKSATDAIFGQPDQDQLAKWGFGLRAALAGKPNDELVHLAWQCNVSVDKLTGWIDETEQVPRPAQDILAAILGKPKRELFTSEAR